MENFNDPALLTDAFHDAGRARGVIREIFGRDLLPIARGALGVGRGQLRQALGRPPGHPGV